MREIVKDIRDGFNDKEWFILGDGDATTTYLLEHQQLQ
jgi:hypothetical protein